MKVASKTKFFKFRRASFGKEALVDIQCNAAIDTIDEAANEVANDAVQDTSDKPQGSEQSVALTDPEFYQEFYTDLQPLTNDELEEHWRTQGQIEGRFDCAHAALEKLMAHDAIPEDFDVNSYLKLNADLAATMKWPFQAVDHYIQFGAAENRRYCEEQVIFGRSLAAEKLAEQYKLSACTVPLDTEFYQDNYPDLKSLSCADLEKHWSSQGQIEGRFGNPDHALQVMLDSSDVPDDFDVDNYLLLNQDIKHSSKWPFQAVHHYLEYGANENRPYKVKPQNLSVAEPVEFDPDFYRVFNTDLVDFTDEECLQHYKTIGALEGRSPGFQQYLSSLPVEADLSDRFNLPTYIRKNSDLIGYFDSKWAYFRHFVLTGLSERRSYLPDNFDKQFVKGYYDIALEAVTAESALREIRKNCDKDKFDLVFLNENELVHYCGFKHAAFLSIFDHEAYIYLNGEATESLIGKSRAQCLEHFLVSGYKKCLHFSYDIIFSPSFYGREYRSALMHLVRDEDTDSDTVWAIPAVGKRIYEHWVRFGIHEGKFANLSEFLATQIEVRLPAQVQKDIDYFEAIHADIITDSRPSRVFDSFLSHGIEEGRFQITHSVETARFYCKIANHFSAQSKPHIAIRIHEDLLTYVPGYPLALHSLGDELIKCNFFGKAIECYQILVNSGAATQWVYLNLAECYKHVSDFSSAAKTLQKARKAFPSDIYIGERSKELDIQQFDEAMNRSRTLVQKDQVLDGLNAVRMALENFSIQRVDERVSRDTKKIAIVGNHDLAQCKFYRIDQKQELLTSVGYAVDIYKHTESLAGFYTNLGEYEAVIFYRVPSIPCVIDAINATNIEGIPSIYDVDDLIFDTQYFPPEFESYGGQISEEVHGHLTVDTALMEHAISMCEYGIASTRSLAGHMERFVRSGQVAILKNGFSSVHRKNIYSGLAEQSEADSNRPITIFYGSGTKAHKSDFHEIVEPVLRKLHEKYHDKIRFLVMGHIAMTDTLKSLGDCLTLLNPVSDIELFWDILRTEADINLAVLSSTPVTDTKSEIKWLEASMFEVPSVVSSTATYEEVVEHGVTGYVCADQEAFYTHLDALVEDKELRRRLGSAAKRAVINEYNVDDQARTLVNCLRKFKSNASQGKKRVAVVNVFYPPEAIGGATRVVHDNVLDMKSSYGDALDIQVFCTGAGSNPFETKQYEQDGIKVTAVTCPAAPNLDKKLSDVDMGIAFKRFLINFKPDIVHFHCIQRLTESIVTETRRLSIPYVITAHDGWWISDEQFLINSNDEIKTYKYNENLVETARGATVRQKTLQKELQGAEKILAVSEPFSRLYSQAGLNNVVTVENGVSGLSRTTRTKSANGKVRLAHIGGMQRHKGLHMLKNVLVSTPDLKNLELLVIDHAANFGSIRTEMWGNTRVTFKAKTPQSNVADLYSEVDVLVAPSVWPESYGLVTREALYCGCWVIASDRGAIGESITEGENGYIVSVDDIDELKATLMRMDQNTKKYTSSPSCDFHLRESKDQASDLVEIYFEILDVGHSDSECN